MLSKLINFGKNLAFLTLFLALTFIFILSDSAVSLELIDVVVKRVIDGDTVELDSTTRVRYIGIDTPELSIHGKPADFYGEEARDFNKQLVEGKSVKIKLDKQSADFYGRMLAYIYLEDGTFVNAELLKYGYARVATYPPNVKYVDLFMETERTAQEARLGMWSEYDFSRPYDPDLIKLPEVFIKKVLDGDTLITDIQFFGNGISYLQGGYK